MTAKVLYIEDDAAQARLVRKCMEREGFAVDVVGDGEAALVACKGNSYDAIVVDQTLPTLSGLEVIRALASEGSLPPAVMVTGTGNERIAVDAMKLGVSDYLVKDLEGGFVHVLPLVVRRAIDQRRLLYEKQRMEKELAQAHRMQAIGQLAAGIAHEINTPNQYIGNNARFLQGAFAEIGGLLDSFDHLLRAARAGSITDDMVKEMEEKYHGADLDYLTREIPQAIQQSLEGVEHVANIVGAMKEFSHPSSGQKQQADLNRVIEGTITLCRNEWNHLANVVTNFDPELPMVHCLPTDINRLMVNLMVNAAHAIAEATHNGADGKGMISVSTLFDNPWAEIRVKDTGAGIPEEARSRIFDLFFTTKEVGKGTGQGLAIVHAIVVEKHGGTIDFETEVGKGTTFIVRLPIDGKPISSAKPDEAITSSPATASGCV